MSEEDSASIDSSGKEGSLQGSLSEDTEMKLHISKRGNRSISVPNLKPFPTTALSYVEGNRRDLSSNTVLTRRTSELTSLLSEVLVDSGSLGAEMDAMSSSSLSFEREDDENEEEVADEELEEQQRLDRFLSRKKQYFILSMAGKPIYSMYGTDEMISGYMGIFQAIVSYFVNEQLRSVRAGDTLFVFSIQDPIILIAVDKLGQSEMQLQAQLDVLYAQILSTLTKSQLSKAFKGRNNFDLRSLLGGTEVFLSALTKEMSLGSPGILLGSLECLKLRKSIRSKINNVLLDRRTKNLLYGMIVADSRLVSVIRPRKHSLHPPDLHLLFSMLFNTTSFTNGGEHWVPICLPKFNSTGFLYAYISFFQPSTALVLLSPDKSAFFEMQESQVKILQDLTSQDLLSPIAQSISLRRPISPAPVRHFLYKSKFNVQFVMPEFGGSPHERHNLMTVYHRLHAAVHAKQGNWKVYHAASKDWTALAWTTPGFEVYCIAGKAEREVMEQYVKSIVGWVKQYEERLFVIGGAVF